MVCNKCQYFLRQMNETLDIDATYLGTVSENIKGVW